MCVLKDFSSQQALLSLVEKLVKKVLEGPDWWSDVKPLMH